MGEDQLVDFAFLLGYLALAVLAFIWFRSTAWWVITMVASISIAGARVENVDALVIEKGLASSLLGMSYLGRLRAFEATQSALILKP